MDFTLVDGYLLGSGVSKGKAVAALLAHRSPDPVAAPFYRGLEAVGERAADEALLALRLVLAGKRPSDDNVRRLRAASAAARAASAGDERALSAALKRDREELAGIIPAGDMAAVAAAATAAYRAQLSGERAETG